MLEQRLKPGLMIIVWFPEPGSSKDWPAWGHTVGGMGGQGVPDSGDGATGLQGSTEVRTHRKLDSAQLTLAGPPQPRRAVNISKEKR